MTLPSKIEDRLVEVVRFVADNDGVSISRVAKQLGLAQSELSRLLVLLGEDASMAGLGLIECREEGSRRLLSLSRRGREWLAKT
jgi:DNA-binding transcriptional ArsR family regulator